MVETRGASPAAYWGLALWAGKGFISISANPVDSAVGTTSYISAETPSTNKISSAKASGFHLADLLQTINWSFQFIVVKIQLLFQQELTRLDEGFILSYRVTGTFPVTLPSALVTCLWSIFSESGRVVLNGKEGGILGWSEFLSLDECALGEAKSKLFWIHKKRKSPKYETVTRIFKISL